MGPEGNILVNSSISTFQQGLTHSALEAVYIFFDTATYNEIERDVKVTKNTVLALGFIHCNALEA